MVHIDDQLVADLAARVEALERRLDADRGPDDRSEPPTGSDGLDRERFWALRGLRQRLGADGGVLVTGTVTLPDTEQVAAEWQQSAGTNEVLAADWSDAAEPLSSLGHPVRLQLLQAVLSGTTTTTELADLEVLGTRGQLHHHLRELAASGWIRTVGRGVYQVPAPRIVPLLAIITGARR